MIPSPPIGAARHEVRVNTDVLGLLAMTAALTAPAQGVDLLARDLSVTPAELVAIDEASVRYVDASGATASVPRAELAGIAWLGESTRAGSGPIASFWMRHRPGEVRLTDGQRLSGAPSVMRRDGEMVGWVHTLLGEVTIPLDRIDRMIQARTLAPDEPGAPLPRAADRDVVLMANGDRLEGFVAELGDAVIIESEGRETVVPVSDIDQIALANPRQEPSGAFVWLADGTVMAVRSIEAAGGAATLVTEPDGATESEPDRPGHRVPAESLRSVVFDTRTLRPLSALLGAELGTGAFGAEPVSLRGIEPVRLSLPEGASWLSLSAELPLRARAWGRCEVLIVIDGVTRARLPLGAEAPRVPLRLNIAGGHELELRLQPGPFGPVQLLAELHDGLVSAE
jgi:hypothetical protein